MEKTVFTNQTFYTLILLGIGILISWNLYIFSISQNLIALLPTFVQFILLVLIMSKSKHAKLGIKIWAIVLIVGPSFSIVGKTIQVLLGDDVIGKVGPLVIQILILFAGLTIYHYNNTTVEVKNVDVKD